MSSAQASRAGRQEFQRYNHADLQAAAARVEMLAKVMDSAIPVPGTNVRIGLDSIIGLVPIVGDLVSQAVSSYIIWEAKRLGVSNWTMARMIGNSALDTVIGAIPVLGDAFDVAFKANLKNLTLLRQHLEKTGALANGPVIDGQSRRAD
jgi:hypothetical protein